MTAAAVCAIVYLEERAPRLGEFITSTHDVKFRKGFGALT